MILVTGATGNVGRALVDRLLAADVKVRAGSRQPERNAFPEPVDVVRVDPDKRPLPPALLDGVERVFLMGPVPCLARHADHLCDAARRAGVRHIVMLSSSIVELGAADELSRAHRGAEQTVTDSGIAWTFLRPGAFMSNTLAWADAIRRDGRVQGLVGDYPAAPIDPDDIAAVALEVLLGDVHAGTMYSLTGPEQIRPSQQVATLAELLDRRLTFDQASMTNALALLMRTRPRLDADSLLGSLRRPDVPWAQPLPTAHRLTGRRPTTFRDWAGRHLERFR